MTLNKRSEWHDKPSADHTWVNLQTHFSQAQQKLKNIRGPTMRQGGFSQANHIATTLCEEMEASRSKLVNMLAIVDTKLDAATQSTSTSTLTDSTQIAEEQANATILVNDKSQIYKMISQMQDEMKKLATTCTNLHNMHTTLSPTPNPNGNRNARCNCKTPDNPPWTRQNTSKYCWTHGACAHDSTTCTCPASGHKKEATFDNTMGGSLAFTQ